MKSLYVLVLSFYSITITDNNSVFLFLLQKVTEYSNEKKEK